jgi:hydrogenase nickel incorporation protein HypA/HybF
MHELALSQNIIDVVCRQAAADGARRVRRVRIAIGALSPVQPNAIEFCFDAVSRGTLAEGAVLDIDRPPGRAHCQSCDRVVTISGYGERCPVCGGQRWVLVGGDDLRVLELEVE